MKKIFGLLLLMFFLVNIQESNAQENKWTGSWATAPEFTGKGDMPANSLSNRSVRNIIPMFYLLRIFEIRLCISHSFYNIRCCA